VPNHLPITDCLAGEVTEEESEAPSPAVASAARAVVPEGDIATAGGLAAGKYSIKYDFMIQ